MSKSKESFWERVVKRVTGQRAERPPANPELNTARLMKLPAEDPVYKLVVDHGLAAVGNELQVVLDPQAPAELRLRHADRAAGVKAFLEDLEVRREGWNAVAREEEEKK